jgi:hypothetical protein
MNYGSKRMITAWGGHSCLWIISIKRFSDTKKYEPNSEMVWSIEAETRDETIARYHEFMGWESNEPTNGE